MLRDVSVPVSDAERTRIMSIIFECRKVSDPLAIISKSLFMSVMVWRQYLYYFGWLTPQEAVDNVEV
jgi:hypothetical protein